MRFFANKWVLSLSVILTILMTYLMYKSFGPLKNDGGLEVIYLQFSYTPERFLNIVHRWGFGGINVFLFSICLDYIYPVLYAFVLSGLIARAVLKRGAEKIPFVHRLCFFLPFLAAAIDYAENILHVRILSNMLFHQSLETIAPLPVLMASFCATTKWALILFSVGSILYLGKQQKLSLLNQSKIA